MSSSSHPPAAQAQKQPAGQFKSFVTQTQVDERRQKRQEEWDKVRKPDEPIDAPEEACDSRSLFYRLQEQKDKKQAEFEEAHKLKNMIKGLDDDEVNFLDFVDKTREEMEARRLEEEGREIAEYRKAVATLAEKTEGQRLQELKNATTGVQPTPTSIAAHSSQSAAPATQRRTSQSALLAGAVKRKSVDIEEAKKRPKSDPDVETSTGGDCPTASEQPPSVVVVEPGQLTCIGVLPGLGVYTDSSDSDESSEESVTELLNNNNNNSSSSGGNNYDLLGRARWQAAAAGAHQQTSSFHGGKG